MTHSSLAGEPAPARSIGIVGGGQLAWMLARERDAIRSKIKALEERLLQTQGLTVLGAQSSSPQALLDKVRLHALPCCWH